jgi:daunorubicin resistance ABC transporter membrane protein
VSAQGPSAISQEIGLALALWQREMFRLVRERSRWAAAVVQPILFWLIIGSGMADSFSVPDAGGVDALTYFFPGIVVMVVLMTSLFTTISVVEDRQSGFLQGVLVAPGSRLALVVGKVAGVVTLTLLQCTLFIVLAPLAGYDLLAIQWPALIAVVVIACVGLTAGCFCMAWLTDSVMAYHAIMSVLLIPLWFLSGALFPPPQNWIRHLMVLNPLTYAVDGVRGSLIEGALGVPGVLNSSLGPVRESLLFLTVFATLALLAAARICARPRSAGA